MTAAAGGIILGLARPCAGHHSESFRYRSLGASLRALLLALITDVNPEAQECRDSREATQRSMVQPDSSSSSP